MMGQVGTAHRPQDIGLKTSSSPHTFSVLGLGCGTGMMRTRKGTLPRPHHYPWSTTRLSLCLPHQVLRRQIVGRELYHTITPLPVGEAS